MNETNLTEIFIDVTKNKYCISGGIEPIKTHRRAASNFESYGAFFDDDLITIPFSTESNHLRYDLPLDSTMI